MFSAHHQVSQTRLSTAYATYLRLGALVESIGGPKVNWKGAGDRFGVDVVRKARKTLMVAWAHNLATPITPVNAPRAEYQLVRHARHDRREPVRTMMHEQQLTRKHALRLPVKRGGPFTTRSRPEWVVFQSVSVALRFRR